MVCVGLDSPQSVLLTSTGCGDDASHQLYTFLGNALYFTAMRNSQTQVLSHIIFSLRQTDSCGFHTSLGYTASYEPATAV